MSFMASVEERRNTGAELRVAREALGASRAVIAQLLGVSYQRIAALEDQPRVTAAVARRYLAAVEVLVATKQGLEAARSALADHGSERS